MGMTHQEAARIEARRTPTIIVSETKQRGHGRGKTQPADKTDIGLRGVPVIGHGSGAVANSAPGGELGAGARLDQDARDLLAAGKKIVRNRLQYRA